MSKVKQYKIVFATHPKDVYDEVQKMIDDGWQPRGSAFTGQYGICQPMVKYVTVGATESGTPLSAEEATSRRERVAQLTGSNK